MGPWATLVMADATAATSIVVVNATTITAATATAAGRDGMASVLARTLGGVKAEHAVHLRNTGADGTITDTNPSQGGDGRRHCQRGEHDKVHAQADLGGRRPRHGRDDLRHRADQASWQSAPRRRPASWWTTITAMKPAGRAGRRMCWRRHLPAPRMLMHVTPAPTVTRMSDIGNPARRHFGDDHRHQPHPEPRPASWSDDDYGGGTSARRGRDTALVMGKGAPSRWRISASGSALLHSLTLR
jgi:hypothetical protein